jgi:hypothetical protein
MLWTVGRGALSDMLLHRHMLESELDIPWNRMQAARKKKVKLTGKRTVTSKSKSAFPY